jgi:Caspase domain
MAKRAVVVGINDYSIIDPSGNSNLSTCINDANDMAHLLIDAFGFDPSQVYCYTNRAASSAAIQRALAYVLQQSEAGDVVCFYYSGHGSRFPATAGQADSDRYYEAIIPASGAPITDFDLFRLADTLRPSFVNFNVILDSCHSGGMHEANNIQKIKSLQLTQEIIQAIVRSLRTLIPFGVVIPPSATVMNNNVSNVRVAPDNSIDLDEDPNKTLVQFSKSTLLAGCRYTESSWIGSDSHSLLTQAMIDLVNSSNFSISYHDLLAQMQRRVAEKITAQILPGNPGVTQTPQLLGQMNRMTEEFLAPWSDSR